MSFKKTFALMCISSTCVAIPTAKQADLNSDGIVNAADYTLIVSAMNDNDLSADIDEDGIVSGKDYSVLRAYFNKPVEPNPLLALYSRSIDNLGHPQLIWENTLNNGNDFSVQRRIDKIPSSGVCALESLSEDGWCNVINYSLTPSGDNTEFTDNEIRVDPAYPDEYQYRVAVSNSTGLSEYKTAWASNCSQSVNGDQAILNWINDVNTYPAGVADVISLNEIPPSTENTIFTSIKNGKFYIISNDKYIALFARFSGLIGYTHRAYGSEFIDINPSEYLASWRIHLNDRVIDAKTSISGQRKPDSINFDEATQTLRFLWNDVSGLRVQTNWSLESYGRAGLHSNISVTGTATGAYAGKGIEFVRFPILQAFGFPYVTMIRPNMNFGSLDIEFPKNATSLAASMETQNSGQQAQFVGFANYPQTKNHELMYFATEDPLGEPKRFRVQPHSVNSSTGLLTNSSAAEIYLYPQNGTSVSGNSVEMKYDTVMTPMCGTWPRVAKRYRRYALDQSWAKVPENYLSENGDANVLVSAKIHQRVDIPQSIRDGVFWWTSNNGPEKDLSGMDWYMNNVLKKVIGPDDKVNVGIHLYNWHSPGFDTNYPEYEQRYYCGTDREVTGKCVMDMSGVVASVQADGTLVMPYINANYAIVSDRCLEPLYHDTQCNQSPEAPDGSWGWWTRPFFADSASPEVPDNILMRKTKVKRNSANQQDGALSYDAWFNTRETFSIMNLSTPFWERVFDFNVNNVFGFGARGVYLDTFGGGYKPDFSELHGYPKSYPLGHSNYWKDSVLNLANRAQAHADNAELINANNQTGKRFTAAEHFNELYMRDIDVFTNYSKQPVTLIPLIPSIYGDYQIFSGPQLRTGDTKEARSFRLARSFLWGSQMGLTSLAQLEGVSPQINVFSECVADYQATGACDSPNILYARSLASARQNMSHTFSGGELIDLVETTEKTTGTGWCVDQNCDISEPYSFESIQASRWLTIDNQKVIVMTNPNSYSVSTFLLVPENWKNLNVSCFDGNNALTQCASSGTSVDLLPVSLAAYEIHYLVFSE